MSISKNALGNRINRMTKAGRRGVGSALVVLLISLLAFGLSACNQEPVPADDQAGLSGDETEGDDEAELVALSEEDWGNYFKKMGKKTLTFARSFDPAAVECFKLTFYGEGGRVIRVYNDPVIVLQAFDALATLNVQDKTEMMSTDDDTVWTFHMSDGTEQSFTFNSSNAQIGSDLYELSVSTFFTDFERRARADSDSDSGTITSAQYESLKLAETTWDEVYELLGEPVEFSQNDGRTKCAAVYSSYEDGSVVTLEFVAPKDEPANYVLKKKK